MSITKCYLKLSDKLLSVFSNILNIPQFFKTQFDILVADMRRFSKTINNFADSNVELGLYHLKLGNYNDAALRFKLVKKFTHYDREKLAYWLGWVYFMKLDYNKSIDYLNHAGNLDELGLRQFIKSINNITDVPEAIYSMHRDINIASFANRYSNKKFNLATELVVSLNEQVDNLSDEYSILELGSNIGILAEQINYRMQDSYQLTGVELSNKMIESQFDIDTNRYYDNMVQSSVQNFLSSTEQKYDIIYSLNNFVFNKDLNGLFSQLSLKLNPGGYLAFVINTAKETKFSKEQLEFFYDSKYVSDILKKNNFKILFSQNFSFEQLSDYSIFVCSL